MGERGKGRGEAAARGDAERSGSAEGVVGRVKAFNAGIRWGGGRRERNHYIKARLPKGGACSESSPIMAPIAGIVTKGAYSAVHGHRLAPRGPHKQRSGRRYGH